MTATTDLIATYFARAARRDVDAYVDLFAPGAVVEDDGHLHRGVDAVRVWRGSTVPVEYDVLDTSDGDGTTARVRISGEFPGSPVVLIFRFGFEGDGRIASLTIRPEVTP